MTQKILSSLSITLPPYAHRSKDPRTVMAGIFAAWIPLSTALLVSVVEHLPSPPVAQAARFPLIVETSPGAENVDRLISNAVINFESGNEAPVVAYVSKMVAIPESQLPEKKSRSGGMTPDEARELGRRKRAEIARARALENKKTSSTVMGGLTAALDETSIAKGEIGNDLNGSEHNVNDQEHLIGFARLYSGMLSVGDEIYVLSPKYSPAHPNTPSPTKTVVTALYLIMGRNLEPLKCVPAGVIFGIAGLEGHILKSGTLCSQISGGINLAGLNFGSQPIVRVALEPANPGDLDKMINGLRLLEQSDPSAQYEVLESGEHVILTAGELHLERCLKDLRERFARCDIQVGEPIVPYRESIVYTAEMAPNKNKDLPRGTVIGITTSKQVSVRIRVRPLPAIVTQFLDSNVTTMRQLYSERRVEEDARKNEKHSQKDLRDQEDTGETAANSIRTLSLAEFQQGLKESFHLAKAEGEIWTDVVDKIAAFGPKRVGPNVLVDATENRVCQKLLVS